MYNPFKYRKEYLVRVVITENDMYTVATHVFGSRKGAHKFKDNWNFAYDQQNFAVVDWRIVPIYTQPTKKLLGK